MKKFLLTGAALFLVLALLAGCGNSQKEPPADPEPSESTTEAQEQTQPEANDLSYYIDEVYASQIERYYTAISQQWDENSYLDHEMSTLAAFYYEGNPLDNVGFTCMDLDKDGGWELLIGAIRNGELDPVVFEIWTLKNGEPVMLAQSGSHNRYYLRYAKEDNLWSVVYEAENGAANRAVYELQLTEGEFKVTQGIVFDAIANENAPWFMTHDLDWDVSNDTPIDENTATAVLDAGRSTYTAQVYCPYSQYK